VARRDPTHDPYPKLFPNIPRLRLVIRLRNHLVHPRDEVHILNLDEPALHHVTRNPEQDRGEHQRDVVRDEVRRVPVPPKEHGEATEDEDDRDCDEAVPRRIRLEG
jgi:hypothetical protein